ncbi:MAG TPA: xanthine dehydrogenase family protein molybdopterin-binding subunit [Methylomirabilota bacterium]|jgi:aerobic carbon-monoxide dehydrogenase large subunit|nr:xanthine dehydrogenase family protein molybdopterin-binding subunit [Methylomirabilota bacterium]
MAEHAGVVRRREDPRLITGAGEFVDDLRVPGCLHAAMLRTPHAHALIRSIDAAAARCAPGVVGVFVAGDLGAVGDPMPIYAPHPALPVPCKIRPLASDRVRFVGEAVAVVIADDVYRAYDALDLIRVEYEPLGAVVDVEAALAPGAPILHEEIGSNVVAEWRQRVGDAEAALRTAPVVVRTRIRLARGGAHPLEPRSLVAEWRDGRLTIRGAVQMVHRHRGVIAGQLGLREDQVRVIAPPDVGGGFGTKGMYYPEYIVVAELARRLDRPIKWVETRREHTLVACVERDQVHDVEIAATREGTLLALKDDFLHEMGAYTISGLNLPQNAMIHSVGSYVIPTLDLRFRGVVTTTTPVGAYRGAGRPYGTGVIERAMDALARELRLDPIELRRRNLVTADRHPYATGLTTAGRGPVDYDSGDYPRCMALALEALDLPAARREQAEARAQGRYLGIGLVNYVEATATVPNESAVVRVHADGRVTVVSGAAPQGQGHVTMFSRLVGRQLGVDADAIEVLTGDTALVETGGGTYGSRTAAIGGSAALLASRAVLDKARRVAAHLLEAAPADVVVEAGRFSVRGLPSRTLGWSDVAAAAHGGHVPGEAAGLEDTQVFAVSQSSFANGSHAVVLEVDPETGAVTVLRWIVAHDCGHVLEPGIVDGQIHGAVVQGLPDALNVQLAYDEGGQRLTATLMDYVLATAADAPPSFELRHLESPTPLNPLGAKGAGEGGIMPVHPLIAQAIEDALAPFGCGPIERVPVTRADIHAMVAAALRNRDAS